MRISVHDLFNRDNSIYRKQLNTPSVEKEVTGQQPGLSGQEAEKQPVKERLETGKVIDFAQKKDLATDPSLIGTNSNLESLDIEKAISTMQKDKVLQQYSFFVGDINPEDGFVTKKSM